VISDWFGLRDRVCITAVDPADQSGGLFRSDAMDTLQFGEIPEWAVFHTLGEDTLREFFPDSGETNQLTQIGGVQINRAAARRRLLFTGIFFGVLGM